MIWRPTLMITVSSGLKPTGSRLNLIVSITACGGLVRRVFVLLFDLPRRDADRDLRVPRAQVAVVAQETVELAERQRDLRAIQRHRHRARSRDCPVADDLVVDRLAFLVEVRAR